MSDVVRARRPSSVFSFFCSALAARRPEELRMMDERASWLPDEGEREEEEGVSRLRRVDWLLEGVPKDFTADMSVGGLKRRMVRWLLAYGLLRETSTISRLTGSVEDGRDIGGGH